MDHLDAVVAEDFLLGRLSKMDDQRVAPHLLSDVRPARPVLATLSPAVSPWRGLPFPI